MSKLKPTLKFRNLKVTGKYPNWRMHGEFTDTRYSECYCSFLADFRLLVIRQAMRSPEAARKIWYYQDGMPDTTPEECEWDWSAIRDSKPAALEKMYKVARSYVDMDSFKKEIRKAMI